MEAILNSSIGTTIIIVGCSAAILGIQYLCGYKNWKAMGFLLPIILLGCVVLFFIKGQMTFSFRDIVMPIIGLIVMATSYEGGSNRAKARREKELDKMKAKDNL